MPTGYLAIVLHAHLPYVRHPEHERHLEERWLFEAILECYLPLVGMLDRLENEGIPCALTSSLTPTLADMLQDDLLRHRFDAHLARVEALQRRESRRVNGDQRLRKIVTFYGEWIGEQRATWEKWRGDVVRALVHHVEGGRLDLLASAATHAFLPGYLNDAEAIRAQVRIGLRAFESQTGRKPIGFWLPECAYDPAFDEILAQEGVRFSILEANGLHYARPRPPAGVYAPIASSNGVAYFGRDLESGRQVWSRDEGYPGDPSYREFYRDIGFDLPEHDLLGEIGPYSARVNTGLKYHRVTAPGIDLAHKELWDPEVAKERAWTHAGNFVFNRQNQLRHLAGAVRGPTLEAAGQTGAVEGSRLGAAGFKPIVVAPYDAELFGHWWFEGPWFLEGVFRQMASPAVRGEVEPITLLGFLRKHPAMVRATPAASTWGAQGHAGVWVDPVNAWLWRHVHHGGRDALRTLAARPIPAEDERDALRQLAAETMLLQASDWPFILKMQTAEGYALARARAHSARLRKLRAQIEDETIDRAWVDALARRDDFLESLGDSLRSACAT